MNAFKMARYFRCGLYYTSCEDKVCSSLTIPCVHCLEVLHETRVFYGCNHLMKNDVLLDMAEYLCNYMKGIEHEPSTQQTSL